MVVQVHQGVVRGCVPRGDAPRPGGRRAEDPPQPRPVPDDLSHDGPTLAADHGQLLGAVGVVVVGGVGVVEPEEVRGEGREERVGVGLQVEEDLRRLDAPVGSEEGGVRQSMGY